MLTIEKAKEKIDRFLAELYTEYYLNSAGLKEKLEISAIYERYADLTDRRLIDAVKEGHQNNSGEEKKKLRFLLEFLVENLIGRETKDETEEILTLQAEAVINLPEGDMPFRRSEVELISEDNRDRRDLIESARKKVIKELNPLHQRLINKSYDTVDQLGFTGYIPMCQELSGIDLSSVKDTMEEFLGLTEEMFKEVFSHAMEKSLGIKLENAKKHDASYLFRAKEYDRFFPADNMLPAVKRFVDEMGIDINCGGHILFDIEKRDKKSPRAFCAPIEVPDKIYLVIMPHGGVSDWLTFLHELGHSLHFGYVERSLSMEYKRFGDNSVTESFAFLLEHLMLNRKWLERYSESGCNENYLKYIYLWKLYMLRRYASKIRYEMILHKAHNLSGKDAIYKDILTKGCMVRYDSDQYLNDLDMGFYAARYIRAWIFESMMVDYLKSNFDEDWFRNKKAGDFLKELWRYGQRYTIDELVLQLGYNKLDIKPLIDDIKENIL